MWCLLLFSDMSYGSRYTLDDVVQSMKKTGVGLKGKSYEDLLTSKEMVKY